MSEDGPSFIKTWETFSSGWYYSVKHVSVEYVSQFMSSLQPSIQNQLLRKKKKKKYKISSI